MAKSKKKRPHDLNQLAASITNDATQQKSTQQSLSKNDKNPAAVALGRLGGLKGGKARTKKLTAEQRKEIARLAANARWKKSKG